jgi:hypothetical protein
MVGLLLIKRWKRMKKKKMGKMKRGNGGVCNTMWRLALAISSSSLNQAKNVILYFLDRVINCQSNGILYARKYLNMAKLWSGCKVAKAIPSFCSNSTYLGMAKTIFLNKLYTLR